MSFIKRLSKKDPEAVAIRRIMLAARKGKGQRFEPSQMQALAAIPAIREMIEALEAEVLAEQAAPRPKLKPRGTKGFEVTTTLVRKIRAMRAEGAKYHEIAHKLGIGVATASKYATEEGYERAKRWEAHRRDRLYNDPNYEDKLALKRKRARLYSKAKWDARNAD